MKSGVKSCPKLSDVIFWMTPFIKLIRTKTFQIFMLCWRELDDCLKCGPTTKLQSVGLTEQQWLWHVVLRLIICIMSLKLHNGYKCFKNVYSLVMSHCYMWENPNIFAKIRIKCSAQFTQLAILNPYFAVYEQRHLTLQSGRWRPDIKPRPCQKQKGRWEDDLQGWPMTRIEG